ncbi:hypothetical protein GCM10011351_25840 [Paraliobacillus quinghaiensis]|uniref:Amidase n=1 Tax=Paraliobacillus quinghaiensis TaxID=470815 RepID=A0A917WW90_9BACI|nr:amidase family protein [Paraliobacillus quinghaiensis]GGM38564.1 hypothetical protein GCM10011351_25840 [Paraliobacillus quinghaiensis]
MTFERVSLAERELGKSVVYINRKFKTELKSTELLHFGIKDTNQIPHEIIRKLIDNEKYQWLTVDKMSDKGRGVDTDLINPLTYRVMTGSTSGGPINILKGINDFAIGTDGGGSVLAPAISCQLPSMIGAGLGLFVKNKKVSTDGLEYRASIGVIAKRIAAVTEVMETMIDEKLIDVNKKLSTVKVAIPKDGPYIANQAMRGRVTSYLEKIDCQNYSIVEVDMEGIEDRKKGIGIINHAFNELHSDLIVTTEGPIDVYGYGETIQNHFGMVGKETTNNHGKFLVRAANMCKTTAITVPTEELATGIVILTKQGLDHCKLAINLAMEFEKVIQLPEAWKRYFIDNVPHYNGFKLESSE